MFAWLQKEIPEETNQIRCFLSSAIFCDKEANYKIYFVQSVLFCCEKICFCGTPGFTISKSINS